MLHFNKITSVVERTDSKGNKIPFSCTYSKLSGEIIEANNLICISTYHKGTINVKFENDEIRTLKLIRILILNGKKIYN